MRPAPPLSSSWGRRPPASLPASILVRWAPRRGGEGHFGHKKTNTHLHYCSKFLKLSVGQALPFRPFGTWLCSPSQTSRRHVRPMA